MIPACPTRHVTLPSGAEMLTAAMLLARRSSFCLKRDMPPIFCCCALSAATSTDCVETWGTGLGGGAEGAGVALALLLGAGWGGLGAGAASRLPFTILSSSFALSGSLMTVWFWASIVGAEGSL